MYNQGENKDLITIIVPIYNVEFYLPKCIESIVCQSYKNLEIILIDDGSIDGSGAICDEYAAQDTRIKVIHKANGGVSSARNTGLDVAKGKYIFFVDSDDYIADDAIYILWERLKQTKADMVACDYMHVNLDGSQVVDTVRNPFDGMVLTTEDFLHKICFGIGGKNIIVWNKLYSRNIFNNLRFEEGKIHEDVFIFHKICAEAKRIAFVNKPLYFYVQSKDSITRKAVSIQDLDILEAYILRARYLYSMKDEKNQKACYNTINVFFQYFLRIAERLNFDDDLLNCRIKAMRKEIVSIIPIYYKNSSVKIKEKISMSILVISPRFYGKIFLNK